MRRQDPVSVKVRNPSRGLVTRMPSDEADQFRSGDRGRVSVRASNVRYAKGVVNNAPGFEKIVLNTPILSDIAHYWSFDEAAGSARKDAVGISAFDFQEVTTTQRGTGLFKGAAHLNVSGAGQFATGPLTTDQSLSFSGNYDLTLVGWVKFDDLSTTKTLFSKGHNPVEPFDEYTITQVGGSGIRYTENWSGTNQRFTILNGALLSTGVWYFIALRKSGNVTTLRVNSTVITHTETGGFPYYTTGYPAKMGNSSSAGFLADSFTSWTRALTDGELDALYNSGSGLIYPFNTGPFTLLFQGNLIQSDVAFEKPVIACSNAKIWELGLDFSSTGQYIATMESLYTGNVTTDNQFGWSAANFFNRIIAAQHDNKVQSWFPQDSATRDLPGLPSSDAMWDGVEVFFGHTLLWKQNRLKWSDVNDTTEFIPIGTTVSEVALTLADSGGGIAFTQPAVNASVTIPVTTDPTIAGLVVGQFVRLLDNRGGAGIFYNTYLVTAVTSSNFTGTLVDLTGVTPASDTVASGQTILSLTRNEAGEANIIGADMNGPIYKVLAQGDYAYIFKERSIHSVQYVGVDSGVFFIHPEIANEGLLSRSGILGMGDGRIIFVGHREIYLYTGGPNLQPICQQVSREFYSTLDRTRLDEIVIYHKEFDNEIWINFPIVGGTRVLVWNYVEDTATYDDYDVELDGITALCAVDWSTDPTWNSISPVPWDQFDPTKAWEDLVLGNLDRITVMAMGNGELFVGGVGFNRDGDGYTAISETMDYDFGIPDNWKYVETVILGLNVKDPDTSDRLVYVQIGARSSLDQPIGQALDDMTNWTAPLAINVKGNAANPPIRVNPGGSGRFIRMRVYSTDPDVEWAVTSYEIHARAGGIY